MFFSTLTDTKITLKLLDKIEFFTKNNYFKCANNGVMLSKNLENKASNVIKHIMNTKDKIVEDVNFMFIDDFESNWTFLVVADKQTPMIIINETSITEHFKKNIRRYESKNDVRFKVIIFAISLYMVGINILVDCFSKPILEKSQAIWDFGNEISNKILEYKEKIQKEFSFYHRVSEPKLSKIFTMDKKYVYSVLLSFKDEKINKLQACDLLDFNEYKEFDDFFESYEKTCELALLDFRLKDER